MSEKKIQVELRLGPWIRIMVYVKICKREGSINGVWAIEIFLDLLITVKAIF